MQACPILNSEEMFVRYKQQLYSNVRLVFSINRLEIKISYTAYRIDSSNTNIDDMDVSMFKSRERFYLF